MPSDYENSPKPYMDGAVMGMLIVLGVMFGVLNNLVGQIALDLGRIKDTIQQRSK